MTISTRDQLIDALGNNSSRFVIDKASIASQAAGTFVSLWRATGQPGQHYYELMIEDGPQRDTVATGALVVNFTIIP